MSSTRARRQLLEKEDTQTNRDQDRMPNPQPWRRLRLARNLRRSAITWSPRSGGHVTGRTASDRWKKWPRWSRKLRAALNRLWKGIYLFQSWHIGNVVVTMTITPIRTLRWLLLRLQWWILAFYSINFDNKKRLLDQENTRINANYSKNIQPSLIDCINTNRMIIHWLMRQTTCK